MERLGEAGAAGKKAGLRRLNPQKFEGKVAHRSASFVKVGLEKSITKVGELPGRARLNLN